MQPTPPTPTAPGPARVHAARPKPPIHAPAAPSAGPSTARITRPANPNPTPAATPPPAHRKDKAARPRAMNATPNSNHPNPAEPIDVDEMYARKYNISSSDGIEAIGAGVFRSAVRQQSKGKEKERERGVGTAQRRSASATASAAVGSAAARPDGGRPAPADPRTHVEHPSTLDPALFQQMKTQKRRAPDAPQPPSEKRRRVLGPLSTHVQDPAPQPQAGPSVHGTRAPLPNAVASSSSHAHAPARAGSIKRKPPPAADDNDDDGDSEDVVIVSDSRDPPVATARKRARHAPGREGPGARHTPGVPATAPPQTPVKRSFGVIELSSDGEVMGRLPPKKPRGNSPVEVVEILDSDEEVQAAGSPYEPVVIPDSDCSEEDEDEGWDLNDPHRWTPMPDNSDKFLDDKLVATLEQLQIADPEPARMLSPLRYVPPDTSKFDQRRTWPRSPKYVWDMLALAVNVHVKRRLRPFAFSPPSRVCAPSWNEDFGLHRLKRAFHDPSEFEPLKKAPGCINRVEQKGCWTVAASGCLGGLPDAPDEEPSPYNREGSLMVWDGELDIPRGHQEKKTNPDRIKHYAVHDVKFDPLRQAFVSCGADRKVRLWDLYDADELDPNFMGEEELAGPPRPRWVNQVLKTYRHVPYELTFKPGSSILAVGEKRIYIYSFSQEVVEPRATFQIHSQNERHHIGAITWGAQATSNHLFASSEPDSDNAENTFRGLHKAYDLQRKAVLYQFDATEAGDTLALGPTGDSLALSTCAEGHSPLLRLYDVARQTGTATAALALEGFAARHAGFEGEVNSAAFSPDGVLLALARNDNETHVYDVRALRRGPLFRYGHTGACRAAAPGDRYGVVKAAWLQSARTRRMALVTGGEDGCVRVWDPQISAADPGNGAVVAEVNSDIGHFSIGDPFAGEHRLVVGDCSGELYFFNNII